MQVIGFHNPPSGPGETADGAPYSLTDLAKAMKAHLHPLMVRIKLTHSIHAQNLFQNRQLLNDVSKHLRDGADGLDSLCSKIYLSGENLLALSEHAQSQSDAFTVHTAMMQYGLPSKTTPYHKVRYFVLL